jgi:uncharacterized linocin/CFP29 family protein
VEDGHGGVELSSGREALAWSPELWSRIDQAVFAEVDRVGIGLKILSLRGPFVDATTVAADIVDLETMTVADGAVVPLVELSVEFRLTEAQVEAEADLGTAVTLASRAASLIAQAEDLLIFRGDEAADHGALRRVGQRGTAGAGLLGSAGSTIDVELSEGRGGESIADAVARAYAQLQATSQAGPYALVLHGGLFAETLESIKGGFGTPADSIRTLMPQGFFGTAALPERCGLVLSTGGGTMDLVVGSEPVVSFLQVDGDGLYQFRLAERFAVRLKDPGALVRLNVGHASSRE